SVSATMRSKARRRISARARGAVAAQSGNARTAASTADFASDAVPSDISAMTAQVAGSSTSNVEAAPRPWPLMKTPCLASNSAMTSWDFIMLPLRVEAAQLVRLGDAFDGKAGRGGAQR